MTQEEIREILEKIRSGSMSPDEGMIKLRDLPYQDIGHTKIDHHRELRTGYPEIIFCHGKTPGQVAEIFQAMLKNKSCILATRASHETYLAVKKVSPGAVYNSMARTISLKKEKSATTKTFIALLTAGTSDMPVAEEASETAFVFGNKVEKFFDVGVAGIHRLYGSLDRIRQARVIIVIAGMEGALPSIVGGLVDKPVIAVPTSIGYGASLNGLAALLGMLTSCASGVSVVNIDNGFGAGYLASMINHL